MSNIYLHPHCAGDLNLVAATERSTSRIAVYEKSQRYIRLLTPSALRDERNRRHFTHEEKTHD